MTRRADRALVALALLLGLWTPALGQQTPALRVALPSEFALSFDRFWQRYRDAYRAGDTETAMRLLEEMDRLRMERNVFHLHDVALALSFEASARLAAGDAAAARELLQTARRLDATLPAAYHGLARLARAEGPAGTLTALAHDAGGYVAGLRSPTNRPYAIADALFLLFGGVFALAAVFALLMTLRYGVLVHHDLWERLGERLGPTAVLALTLAVFLAPAILTFGLAWLPALWLVLTFAYQSWKERAVTIAAIVFLLAAAPLAELHAGWSTSLENPWFRASISSVDGTFEPAHVARLEEARAENPDDRDLWLLLAIQYKNLGEYDRAAAIYREMLERWPDDLAARVNLGNIYFAQKDWEGALVQYDAAIEAHPDSLWAFYNKSLAHAENFQFREREDARARADRLGAATLAAYERRTEPHRVVADLRPDATTILAKFFGLARGVHPRPVSILREALTPDAQGRRFVLGAVALLVLLVGLELGASERRGTRRCWKCGSAFCGRCQIGTGRKGVCTQCHHLFFVKDGVSTAARNEKLHQVQRRGERRGLVFRVLSFLAPGAGHIVEDATLVGLALLAPWAFAVAVLVIGPVYPLPDWLFGLPAAVGTAVAATAVLLLVAAANLVPRPVGRG